MNTIYSEILQEIEQFNLKTQGKIECRSDECLAHHSTFRIGGMTDLFLVPSSETELRFLIRYLKARDIRTLVIGKGSNLLFDDAGFRGAVITTEGMRNIFIAGEVLSAEAGATLNACARTALDLSLSGLEFSYGIPGTVGGAVFMNAGAYDGEVSQVLLRSRYYDMESDSFGEYIGTEHQFDYRDSIYRHMPHRIILSADFQLFRGDHDEIRFRMNDLMHRRADKQPLEYPSAGSTFKRCPGRYTAQMIDEAGLKGYTIGTAQVSEKHAGFVINRGDARSSDVLALIDHIKAVLLERYGVEIETEVVYVPEK